MGDFVNNLASSAAGGLVDAASGLLDFGLGQIGAAIQWKREKKKMNIQQQHALEQMAKSQEYNLENMAQQNEYQIAAEKRANEYNSVGAQVERARQAGVSPLAALGSGGAGGTMSVSSAPSGGTPSGSAPSGGVPSSSGASFFDLARGAELGSRIRNIEQDTELKAQQTRSQELSNQFEQAVQASRINIEKAKEQGINIDNQQKSLDYEISQLTKSLTLQEKQNKVLKSFAEILSIYNAMSVDRDLADSQIALNDQQIVLKAAEVGLVNAKTDNVVADTRLKGAEFILRSTENEYMQLKKQLIDAQIISQNQANEIDKFRNDFEREHKEKDWKRSRTNEAVKTWTSAVSNVIDSASGAVKSAAALVGVLTPAGQVVGSVETVISTIENYNSKGKLTGYTTTTTQKDRENFGK